MLTELYMYIDYSHTESLIPSDLARQTEMAISQVDRTLPEQRRSVNYLHRSVAIRQTNIYCCPTVHNSSEWRQAVKRDVEVLWRGKCSAVAPPQPPLPIPQVSLQRCYVNIVADNGVM
jgi:hypothetical protein